jgi:hypothetical protein
MKRAAEWAAQENGVAEPNGHAAGVQEPRAAIVYNRRETHFFSWETIIIG